MAWRTTLKDVAGTVGLSTTVSMVLNERSIKIPEEKRA